MTKYIIQDIIPPDKKKSHDSAHKRSSIEHPHHEGGHSKSPEMVSPHSSKTVHHKDITTKTHHTETHHKDVTHDDHDHNEEHIEYVHESGAKRDDSNHEPSSGNEHSADTTDATVDPRGILLEQLYKGNQVKSDAHEMAGEWPYNNSSNVRPSDSSNVPPHFPEEQQSSRFGSWLPWVAIPAIILAGVFVILNFFGGATVSVIAKHDIIPIPDTQTFEAVKNSTDASLGYSVMKVTLDDSREVSATGVKTVTAKASGSIIVYNEQSVAQRLIRNTRFQSIAGKIYRINDSITVPKATTPKGGKLTPGTIKVIIYADEAGPDFNNDPTDFSVPGLKETPQAKKVYGRSVGAVTGGASGTTKSVSDQDLKQASDDLRVSLETKLRTKARGDLAPSQIAYDQGIVVDLGDPALSADKASSNDKAVVTENGSLYMIVFDRDALIKTLAKTLVPTYSGENIQIKNVDALTLAMPEISGDALWKNTTLNFTLKGAPELSWVVDEEAIKKDLLGIPKSEFNRAMAKYTTILRAKASLRPFWKSTFPDNEKKITVSVVTIIAE